jgi:hypothetical protein
LADPERCASALTVMAVVNILSFCVDVYLRPFVVPFRNPAIIVADFFLASGTALAVFPTSTDGETQQVAQGFMMTFLIILILVAVVSFFFSRLVLFLARGSLLLRSDVLKKMRDAFVEAEDTLMETIISSQKRQVEYARKIGKENVEKKQRRYRDQLQQQQQQHQERFYSPSVSYHHQYHQNRSPPSRNHHHVRFSDEEIEEDDYRAAAADTYNYNYADFTADLIKNAALL